MFRTTTTRTKIIAGSAGALWLICVILAFMSSVSAAPSLSEGEMKALSIEMTVLFRSARAFISNKQGLINNPDIGDKGLTGKVVWDGAFAKYEEAMEKQGLAKTLPEASPTALSGQAFAALKEVIKAVMANNQELINEKGKGSKGFLPAVFAGNVARTFTEKMKGTMFIKLTAPRDLLSNRASRADKWEEATMQKFRGPAWKKGDIFWEADSEHKSNAASRLLLPEYYIASCITADCHPGSVGDLGGSISIGIYK